MLTPGIASHKPQVSGSPRQGLGCPHGARGLGTTGQRAGSGQGAGREQQPLFSWALCESVAAKVFLFPGDTTPGLSCPLS